MDLPSSATHPTQHPSEAAGAGQVRTWRLTEGLADEDGFNGGGAELDELVVLVEVTDALAQAVIG